LAVLFIACCRHQGIPARFVSGYFPADPGDRQHMHAWAEAYLPGMGWCAYDPTQGIEAGVSHIASAAAAEPLDATPIAGFFTGLPARSEMQVDLTVEMEPSLIV
jgi:transglutaminase-like putative cysteine protease